jgi:hypothetical protein
MLTLIKIVLGTLLAAFLWLVGSYTTEYFRPYKR